MWLNVDKPGTYTGNCAEFCGTTHYDMLIEVNVLPQADFDAWLADQIAAMSEFVPVGTDLTIPLPPGDAVRGETLFNEITCAACHGGEGGVGPSLSKMAEDAEERGDEADAYLHESIVLPCAYETPGYSCAIMPADYGAKLDAQGLADVIEYLKSFEE
jgi:cytochrome c oxidase subunit 2